MKRKMSPSMKKAWIRFTVLLILAILFLSFALFAGVLAPFDPLESHYADMLKAPNSTYIFGTDQLGRDLFSRILYGGKSSLLIAFTVTAIISSVGILVGTIAGFTGGIFDNLLMRFSDMLMAFPGYIFTIALVSFIGVGLPNMILAMSLTGWTYYARISRSLVLSVKNNVYIEQARLGGASNWKILLHYIIPNVLPSLLVNIFQDIGGELLTISGLSMEPFSWEAADDIRAFSSRTWLAASDAGVGLYAFRRKRLHVFRSVDVAFPGHGHSDQCGYLQSSGRLHPGSDEPERKCFVIA